MRPPSFTVLVALLLPVGASADGVVVYPADGQQHVPTVFPGHEQPDPVPEAHGAAAGYPVTATFPAAVAVKNAHAALRDAAGREIEAWVSSPEKPADPQEAWAQQNTICLIARKPLDPGAAYAVRMDAEADGKAWSRAWTFTTAAADEGAGRAVEAFVRRLNAHRKAAGLEAAAADADLSAPCRAHARYVEKNYDQKDLNWNDEDPALPGFSDEGRRVAGRASVNAGAGPEATADWAVASFVARQTVLEPGLRKMGVGAVSHQSGGFIWVIDAQSGPMGDSNAVVLFPTPDQADVPTAYPSGESPVPVPDADAKAAPGYVATALFPRGAAVADADAHLTDDVGKEAAAYVSSPSNPAIKGFPQRCIGLVPKTALRAGVKYTVVMSAKVGGEAWKRTWSFRTIGDSDDAVPSLAAAALEALNAYRHTAGLPPVELDEKLSKGCQLHARYLARNLDRPAVQGLGMHDEDPSLPGATPEGRRAAKASVVTQEPEVGGEVDGWMDTLFHRVPLLDPDLKRVGYGCARLPDQSWVCVMDVRSGK